MVTLLEQTVVAKTPDLSLTTEEKIRLHQLERVVEKHLDSFLAVGKALAEIRSSRLYRQHFPTFEQYVKERWGLARSRADELIRSTSCAELLAANGVELPANTTEAVVRPVSMLPSPELQVQAWRLVQAASPTCGPSQPIASKVVRVIKNAIEPTGGTNRTGHKPRRRDHPEREVAFLRPITRLVNWPNFSASLVVSHIEKLPSAMTSYTVCEMMIQRCQAVKLHLVQRFPELEATH